MDQVINNFKEAIDCENTYTLKELQVILENSYKQVFKTKGSSKTSDTKKPPSPYNLFIKDEIARMKQENNVSVDPKNYMKLAAQRWQEQKIKVEN
jgi:hypothetical protein